MKKLVLFLLLIPSLCLAANWVNYKNVWVNAGTGQTFYGNPPTYPPGVATFTPTATPASTSTPSPQTNITLSGLSFGSGNSIAATVTSGVVTVTNAANGYSIGDFIKVSGGTSGGVTIGDFNKLHEITGVQTNTYEFSTTASNGPITGSPVELLWFKGTRCVNANLINNISHTGTGEFLVTFENPQPDIFYGCIYAGTDGSHSLWEGPHNVPTTAACQIYFEANNSGSLSPFDPTSWMFIQFFGVQ